MALSQLYTVMVVIILLNIKNYYKKYCYKLLLLTLIHVTHT